MSEFDFEKPPENELKGSPEIEKPRQSERLFILIGLLWLVLGGFILYQLPETRSNFITIEWETETETKTAGFNIYRAPSEGLDCSEVPKEGYIQVNNTLINPKGTANTGGEYDHRDDSVQRGVDYCYQLEDVELDGTPTRHDPIVGPRLRRIDRVLYMILAPVSLIVGTWLIISGLRKGE